MWQQVEHGDQRGEADRFVAVAVDKDKSSHYALRWAVEHFVTRDQTLKLIHVIPPSSAQNYNSYIDQQAENRATESLLSFRCFCRMKEVQCETVILEDTDVSKALIAYVCQSGVRTLLLGAGSRNSLSRLFKTTDVPSNVLKWAPDYCSVYVIWKRKVSNYRKATRPAPNISVAGGHGGRSDESISVRERYEELSSLDMDMPFASSGRLSTDSSFFSFYENLASGPPPQESLGHTNDDWSEQSRGSSRGSDVECCDFDLLCPNSDSKLEEDDAGSGTWSLQNAKNLEDEVRRLKIELNQTMDMYHAACKEAFTLKQKAMELEKWKKSLEEAHEAQDKETALMMEKNAEARCIKNIDEIEQQKRRLISAETDGPRAEDKRKLYLEDDTSDQNALVLHYQSLFHIAAVLLWLYVYFSL
ncbi:hypothetical protein K2173_017790 [Erythroxylum novogranatense]|uniref:RING-type E3 ubiquitin transferase n=1 Tax=Erythroxylum novogranatense TaxID=1862640 RepID=A0AAV8SMC5_9ROSI|nr:hypothetical protein K2173_017790 [Erythroxylum novogranatense]